MLSGGSVALSFDFSLFQVFRKIDGLAEEIERLQPPVDLWRKFIYCTSLTGQILGTVDQMQPQGVDSFAFLRV